MKKTIITAIILITIIISVKAQSDAKSTFNNLLIAYFRVKSALTKDNAVLANAGAKNISANLKSMAYNEQKPVIAKYSAIIAGTKNIDTQRKAFEGLSTAIISLTKNVKLNIVPVYVQYCPMAKKSWLNDVEAIQNPFYGSEMYECGTVTKRLNGK